MSTTWPFTIICASHDEAILRENLLASPCVARDECELILQAGYKNLPMAYNDAAERASNDLLCFLHHDVNLKEDWPAMLMEQVEKVNAIDSDWAVLGCAGVAEVDGVKVNRGHCYDRSNLFGSPEGLPAPVNSLDEFALIGRKADMVFDEGMPNHHLFATELCLRHRQAGRKSYAIDAYCHHNSNTRRLDAGFATAAGYLYAKYPELLPIHATCVTIARVDGVCVFYQ